MITPYYIMRIYDRDGDIVETQEDSDYDYIREVFQLRRDFAIEHGLWRSGKIFKATRGKKGGIGRKLIERFEHYE